ncbi:hypothetical protein D3C80_1413900 [compost metagenome]
MLAGAGQHHDPHFICSVDPAKDLDDLRPEIGVHRVDLFRAVDPHMGDLVCQLDTKGLVVGHGSHPQQQTARTRAERFLWLQPGNYNKHGINVDADLCDAGHVTGLEQRFDCGR